MIEIVNDVLMIDGESFPDARVRKSPDPDAPDGFSWQVRGFHLVFNRNDWTLSGTWGAGSYSSNGTAHFEGRQFSEASPDVEIAAWTAVSGLLPWDSPDGDTVKGYVKTADLLALIKRMHRWPYHAPPGSYCTLKGLVIP